MNSNGFLSAYVVRVKADHNTCVNVTECSVLRVRYPTARYAEIVCRTLEVDEEVKPTMVKKTLSTENDELVVYANGRAVSSGVDVGCCLVATSVCSFKIERCVHRDEDEH